MNTEANKRMAELEREVAELKAIIELDNGVEDMEITQLKAHINDLREALRKSLVTLEKANIAGLITDTIWVGNTETLFDCMSEALSATPAESLQAHDDEVIEKCAKVAMDMPSKADEIHEYRYSDDCKAMAWDISHAIRSLKEVK
jgi:uncharacterized coiled-coil protein SlyX